MPAANYIRLFAALGLAWVCGCGTGFPDIDGVDDDGSDNGTAPSGQTSADETSTPSDDDDDAGESTTPDDDDDLPDDEFPQLDCLTIDRTDSPTIVRSAGVRVGFRVLDCNGDGIPALTADSLSVINDVTGSPFGAGQGSGAVSGVRAPDNYHLYTVLAVDVSESVVESGALDGIVDGALKYVHSLSSVAADDVAHELAVVAFGDVGEFEVVQRFTTDRAAVGDTLEKLRDAEERGHKDLYGSYLRALKLLTSTGTDAEVAERFLVLFTDGEHELDDAEKRRAQALAAKDDADAHVFAATIDGDYDRELVRELASTDRSFVAVNQPRELVDAVRTIAGNVRAIAGSNYVIGVCTPVSTGTPTLTLAVDVPASGGGTAHGEARVLYSTAHLDGNVATCEPDKVSDGRLDCVDEVCEIVCDEMACGCDGTVQCGSCGQGSVCSGDFECVAGTGAGAGDLTCVGSDDARGITVDVIEANQGVGIELARGGAAVPASQRNAPIVESRELLVRAGWQLSADWKPRSIRATLHLSSEFQSVDVDDVRHVEAVSAFDALEHSFAWLIPAEHVRAGTRYSVSFHEVDFDMMKGPGPDTMPRVPETGDVDLGVVAGDKRISIVLVPVTHTGRHCTLTGDAQGVFDEYRTRLYATYPVNVVSMRIRSEAVEYDGELDLDGWIELLASISQARNADKAEPYEYYYGVVDPCSETNGVSGIGYVPGSPTKAGAARYRTGVGVQSEWTFVHELGHNHGRRHVACSGEESNPDADYPYQGGETRVWGFDLGSRELHDGEHTDFMSYCPEDWISDYGWRKVHDVVTTIGEWAKESSQSSDTEREVLVTLVGPSGAHRSWIERQALPVEATRGREVALWAGTELIGRMAAEYTMLSDDQGVAIVTELPPGYSRATHLEHDTAASVHAHTRTTRRVFTPIDDAVRTDLPQ